MDQPRLKTIVYFNKPNYCIFFKKHHVFKKSTKTKIKSVGISANFYKNITFFKF